MTKFLKELKTIQTKAAAAAARKKNKEDQLRYVQVKADEAAGVKRAKEELKDVLKRVREEAAAGKSSYSLCADQTSKRGYNTYIANYTCTLEELLREQGLVVVRTVKIHEPFGSDDYYGCTMYFTYLNISW
jgi:hypothetical protein